MKTKKIHRINRIVVGDVGSGKTVVGFLVALCYLKNLPSGQVSLLAPTEVLAYQHFKNLLELKSNLGKDLQKDFPKIAFLSAKKNCLDNDEKLTKKNFAKNLQNEIKSNPQIKIFWLGTHSLLFNEMVKPNLVMVDEQHKFGVDQRQQLANNQDENTQPHFISFSATPIPRTLALSVFSSLKPYFLETLPSRKAIETKLNYFENFETNIIPEIKERVLSGQKIYIVCTKIEPGDEETEIEEVFSTTKIYKQLVKYFGDRVLEVHGKKAEKKEILEEFKNSTEKQILVTTTVIEVGVDVSEARLMIILNAERYGLAALHQLRGRVGRNNYDDNLCLLVTWKKFSRSKRLEFLQEYQSGFELAQKDLELRGAGDMYGKTQSGFDPEIEALIGLDPKQYEKISTLVNTLDMQNLAKNGLQRLDNYIKKEQAKVWDE